MNDKLKPCPFCGGEAKVIEEYDCMIGINAYFIECCNCRATFYNGNSNKNKEIEKWNSRVNETLIDLPCKVGDTVWELDLFSKQKVREIKVRNCWQIFHWIEDESFGRYLFLTKAEAEKKLEELRSKQ